MIVLRGPTLASNIPDPEIRSLVERRFTEICAGEEYNYDLHGYMIVVEPGDSVESLEKESSCPILSDLFDDTCFGGPDFSPSYEALEEHSGCYEMVFILNDDGFGIDIFIPKTSGIDADLLAMCAIYAVPAPDFTAQAT
ncbi:hypothetical protein [Sulfurirhabdus autotrophica]|uniref:Uncharacterized protein n=1 Tax=Sulfurirhabdus autotrophica TaxID=1706046 RepID=A0A4R3Y4L8_9PROT|nr:hypothetical protein [Sulfurirhabdus autotrophica]TCV86647.1 hypothetical protein EDC63_1068 [Sulfurirhabdus autotrophica]